MRREPHVTPARVALEGSCGLCRRVTHCLRGRRIYGQISHLRRADRTAANLSV